MTRFTLAACLVIAALPALGQGAAVDRTAASMAGQEAQFTHRFTPKGFKTSQVERGSRMWPSASMVRQE